MSATAASASASSPSSPRRRASSATADHSAVHVTDMDAALAAYGVLTERLDAVGAAPPATLVGVSRLAIPSMLVEITATAGR